MFGKVFATVFFVTIPTVHAFQDSRPQGSPTAPVEVGVLLQSTSIRIRNFADVDQVLILKCEGLKIYRAPPSRNGTRLDLQYTRVGWREYGDCVAQVRLVALHGYSVAHRLLHERERHTVGSALHTALALLVAVRYQLLSVQFWPEPLADLLSGLRSGCHYGHRSRPCNHARALPHSQRCTAGGRPAEARQESSSAGVSTVRSWPQ